MGDLGMRTMTVEREARGDTVEFDALQGLKYFFRISIIAQKNCFVKTGENFSRQHSLTIRYVSGSVASLAI